MKGLRRASLVPSGFATDGRDTDGAMTVMVVRAMTRTSSCSACGALSPRVHNRHPRRLAERPVGGRVVQRVLLARRFCCNDVVCARRIFTARLKEIAPCARRTARLDTVVRDLGLALGNRPAASFGRRLTFPVSNDTLLGVVRRYGKPRSAPPSVVGIGDWAWRRNC